MQKILITYGTRPLAIRIAKLLKDRYIPVFATSEEVPSVLAANYVQIPTGSNPTYAHELLKLALDQSIAFVLPLGGTEVESLSESIQLFEEYGIAVICPNKTQLITADVLYDPAKDLPLNLVFNQEDLLTNQAVSSPLNGLGMLSDSEDTFIFTLLK